MENDAEINVQLMLKMIQLYPVFVFVILPVATFMFLFTMLGMSFRRTSGFTSNLVAFDGPQEKTEEYSTLEEMV